MLSVAAVCLVSLVLSVRPILTIVQSQVSVSMEVSASMGSIPTLVIVMILGFQEQTVRKTLMNVPQIHVKIRPIALTASVDTHAIVSLDLSA